MKKIMKMEETAFKELHLPMLSSTGHTLVFGDELLLTDNIGIRIDTESVADFVSPTYPFKVTFTLVMFCRRGRMRVNLNLREYCIADNDVLVVLPGSIGECLEMDSQTEVMVIGFAGFHFIGNYKSAQSMAFRRFFTSTSLMHISPEEMEESVLLYRLMWNKLNEPDYEFKCEVLGGYLQVLFYNGCQWMKRYRQQQPQKVESRQQKLFEDFLELVQKYYIEQRSIAYYAGKLCLTPKYLSQVILKVSGRSASDWIRDYVILEAKVLLRSGCYTAQQVADMLNFSNASFFGKYFKAAVGCSPRKYMLG